MSRDTSAGSRKHAQHTLRAKAHTMTAPIAFRCAPISSASAELRAVTTGGRKVCSSPSTARGSGFCPAASRASACLISSFSRRHAASRCSPCTSGASWMRASCSSFASSSGAVDDVPAAAAGSAATRRQAPTPQLSSLAAAVRLESGRGGAVLRSPSGWTVIASAATRGETANVRGESANASAHATCPLSARTSARPSCAILRTQKTLFCRRRRQSEVSAIVP